jgi:predicted ATPase with chaperone activity
MLCESMRTNVPRLCKSAKKTNRFLRFAVTLSDLQSRDTLIQTAI